MAAPRHDLDKPHPPTPMNAPSPKPLTIESVNHLHKFIGHVLGEETSFRDTDKDAWACGIESALNDFAREVDAGAWLSGIRRARVLEQKRKEQLAAEAKKREQERIAKERETEARNRAKSRTTAPPADTVKSSALAKEADPTAAETKAEVSLTRKPPSEEADRNLRALQQLRNLAKTRRQPSPDDQKRARHLLLTIVVPDTPSSPPPASCVATGDTTAPRCTFTPYVYSLPAPDLFGEDPDDNGEAVVNGTLYGFRDWDVNFLEAHEDIELIGGTFSLNKVLSVDENASIVRVLRLSTYTLLSLLLEQKFLSSSFIKLHYPKSATPPISIPPPTATLTHRNSSPDVQVEAKPRKRDILRQGIWSLLHKRLQRSATVDTSDARGASLDLPRSDPDLPKTPRASLDGSPTSPLRQRRFSIFGGDRAPPPSPAGIATPEPSPDQAFQSALHRIEESKGMLSASPGLVFSPPQLLVRLAESEKEHPSRHLTGEERTALTSILGWEGKKAAGRGNLISTAAFLRQQQLSFLYSEHIYGPGPDRMAQASADITLNKPMVGGEPEQRTYVHCGTPVQWLTYVYYAGCNHDQSLGDMVTSMCVRADDPCTQPGCKARRRQHERRWIHGGIRVVVQTEARNPSASPDVHSEDIEMWQSCKICRKSTEQCKMSDGTYLFSFAKFLEFLLYSSTICTLSQPLCAHTSPSSPKSTSPSSLPASRLNIIRHFSHKSYQVSFTLSSIDDIFDLQTPRLQFMRDGWVEKTPPAMTSNTIIEDTDKKELRQEIKRWWQAVAEHLDKVEGEFTVSTRPKSLPRLPSDDDSWEGDPSEDPSEDSLEEGEGLTPKGLLPVSLPPTPCHSAEPSSSSISTIKPTPTHSGSDTSFQTITSDDLSDTSSLQLLTNMRFAFQRAEQALYFQLRDTPNSALNNVRREFHSAARGANKRLAAWEAKHVSKDARPRLAADREAIQEPHWWHSGFHAVPGGNVIVREEDWGSIIAFTLSSFDYQRELANLMNPRALRGSISHPHSPHPPATPRPQYTMSSLGRSSASSSTSSFKFFSSFHKPDPDREDSVWDEPEAHSAIVTRKEHPRDPTALLSLREVLRHKVPVDGPQSAQSSSITVSRMGNNASPPSAWAKPAVEVNLAAVDGQVTGMPEAVVTAGRILHELDGASVLSSKTSTDSAASGFIETNVHRGKTSSILSRRVSLETLDAIGPAAPAPHHHAARAAAAAAAAAPPERERAFRPGVGPGLLVDPRSRSSTISTTGQGSFDHRDRESEASTDSVILSWTSSLTNAMRYMLKADLPSSSSSSSSSQPATPPAKNHHGLLYADPMTIDERPHVKYDWTIGKRLKFSCTVYYAKQFDALRRRCGVEDVFVRSMAKCEPWKAQGGKSRSNFWKTSDDRFIIKTLVNAWNVADFQVLIDLAPSYFLHMDSTANRASILAKLLGFYTVEVRNLDTGTVQAKADLLVMENLFYNQKPTKTFDLKGIQGRKVNSAASKTLFDSEWIEGQQRALTLVDPVSKAILREATKADCDFLSRSNIMDYSLLLGIDEERKQIHCGLVDTIGSYTFAKTLEYKAKGFSGKEGKNITVVPPHEYQERFVSALDSYFMACPDKWTKPVDETKLIHDPALLPSVL